MPNNHINVKNKLFLPAGFVTDAPSERNVKASNATNNATATKAEVPWNATSTEEKQRGNTTSTEIKQKSTTLVPAEAFKDRYSTLRDASFDGLQWIRNLDSKDRKDIEIECKDVLDYLKYPLVYPQEQINQTTEVPVTEVPVTEVPVTEVPR